MSLIHDIYGLSVTEAMNLSDQETSYLLEKASATMLTMATTSPAMQEILRGQLAPAIREVRDARSASSGTTTKPVGAPPGS